MTRHNRTVWLLSCASVVAVAAAFPALASAQDKAPIVSPDPQTKPPIALPEEPVAVSDGLDDIIVTAQRREENAQRVPIALTQINGNSIAALGIQNTQALAQLLPGVTINRQSAGIVPYIRGVGTPNTAAGNEPAVAMFVDDVYLPTGQGLIFDFNSVESIAVLKGPQGTLFGRNATGGVLQVRTKDPSFDTSMAVDVTYANYDKVSAAAYVSTGLTSNVAMNFAAFRVKQNDGWGRNVLTGAPTFLTDSYGFRGKVLVDFTSKTTLLLTGSYGKITSSQGLGNNVLLDSFGTGGFSPKALGAGFYDNINDFPAAYTNTAMNFSGKFEHEFGDVKLRSITAYGTIRSASTSDLESSPSPFVNAVFPTLAKTFTQEVQLLSAPGSKFNWIVGGFYLHDNSRFDIATTGIAFGTLTSRGHSEQHTSSISGFGQGTLEILPKLNVTFGLRYTSDTRRFYANGSVTDAAGVVTRVAGPFNDRVNFSKLTGKAAIDYRISDDVMVYAAFNRGYKSGIFNLSAVVGTTVTAPPAVKPEVLNAYSAGIKSEFFDHKVRFNVEAYLYKYSNIQVISLFAGTTFITNAAAATIKGVDMELAVKPTRNLTLNASISVADGRYGSFPAGPVLFPLPPNAQIPIPAGCAATVPTYPAGAGTITQRACDLSGNKTANTVPFSATLSGTYDIPTSVGDFMLNGSWSRGGNYFTEPDNTPWVHQPVTNIVNASIGWTSTGGKLGITAWTNNLTKQKYYSNITISTLGGAKFSPAPPRTYGLTGRLRF